MDTVHAATISDAVFVEVGYEGVPHVNGVGVVVDGPVHDQGGPPVLLTAYAFFVRTSRTPAAPFSTTFLDQGEVISMAVYLM